MRVHLRYVVNGHLLGQSVAFIARVPLAVFVAAKELRSLAEAHGLHERFAHQNRDVGAGIPAITQTKTYIALVLAWILGPQCV